MGPGVHLSRECFRSYQVERLIMGGFTPVSLDFGAVAPGSTGPNPVGGGASVTINMAGGVTYDGAPAGTVSASISGDTVHFKLSGITIFDWVWQAVPPGDLPAVPAGHPRPHPKERVLQQVAQSGGSELPVAKGQFVLIQVRYNTMRLVDWIRAKAPFGGRVCF